MRAHQQHWEPIRPLEPAEAQRTPGTVSLTDVAEGVEVCLFGPEGDEIRIELPERSGSVWHGYLPDVGPGVRYGYRVTGPRLRPGDLQDPSKLLLDPYARALTGSLRWTDSVQRTDPVIAFAYGSSSSLLGLKRCPASGSYGPCTR